LGSRRDAQLRAASNVKVVKEARDPFHLVRRVTLRGAPGTPLIPRVVLQLLFIALVGWAGLKRRPAEVRGDRLNPGV
jgi:hypothetical protein